MKKALRFRQLLMVLVILAAAVLIGFKGGAASYLFFWISLILPLSALIFRRLVRSSLVIRLEVEKTSVVRGELLACKLMLRNDSYITIPEIRIRMSEGKIHFSEKEQSLYCSLAPGEEKVYAFHPVCRHYGYCRIGASSIVIPDYFSLTELTYEKIEHVNVLPRQQRIDQLPIAPPEEKDQQKVDRSYFGEMIPDGQWKLYSRGDDIRRVNWKASARSQKLILKNLSPEPKTELVLIPDGRKDVSGGEAGWQAQDDIVEGTLAITDYFLRRGIALKILPDAPRKQVLTSISAFPRLYKIMARNFFSGETGVEDALDFHVRSEGIGRYILLTWEVNEALIRKISLLISRGAKVTLIYIGDSSEVASLAASEKKLSFVQAPSDRDFFSVLSGGNDAVSSSGKGGSQ